jgi:hypothetical protein
LPNGSLLDPVILTLFVLILLVFKNQITPLNFSNNTEC